jgi:2,4-dienoyl-CoA reductase-like NADH-dependent reductase (Old Yellow Enzyme family)
MTGILFSPYNIGSLELPNRFVRSATAERMADADGRPFKHMQKLYEELALGGVGLIITGHMYVHPTGKAHPEMTGIYSDELIPDLAILADVVHKHGGKVAVQINHGGIQCSEDSVSETIAPSPIRMKSSSRRARGMHEEEILQMVQAYGDAARRVKLAGFDAVQIHGAHGYLISQFLSPYVNKRTDQWGGNLENRMRFLREVAKTVRDEVGPDFPVFIKLGMMDGIEGGLSVEDGIQVAGSLEDMGIEALEISGGIGGKKVVNTKKGIRKPSEEAYFRHLAEKARPVTQIPILLVGGLRSRPIMESILESKIADFISLCRPLITEPDLPNLMKQGLKEKSRCLSANNCWPKADGLGIACKCPHEEIQTKV